MKDDLTKALRAEAGKPRLTETQWGLMLRAADRIDELEKLEPIAASMGDPSRTSRFEYGVRKLGDEQRTLHTYPTAIQAVEYLAEMDEVVPDFDADEWEIVVRTITTTVWREAEHERQA